MTQRLRYNTDNRDQIVAYLENGGNIEEVPLNDIQLKLLDRWRFADEKIREGKYKRGQIASFIMGKYGVSYDTAYKDIVNAEHVFASSTPLNKKYLIGLRIELLQQEIAQSYIDGDRFNAAKQEKILQKYIDMYPDTPPPRSPKNIVYKFIQNNTQILNQGGEMTAEEAFAKSDAILKKLEDSEDY